MKKAKPISFSLEPEIIAAFEADQKSHEKSRSEFFRLIYREWRLLAITHREKIAPLLEGK